MALNLLSLALVLGTLLGMQYRVAVLAIVVPLSSVAICPLAFLLDVGMPTMLAWQTVAVIGLQIGYLAGGYLSAGRGRPVA